MSNGSTNKNLLLIIAVLLLTNISVLGYFLWYKKGPKDFHGNNKEKNIVGEKLRTEVGFDSIQLATYREMREKQKKVLRPMFDEMRGVKDSLFTLIGKYGPEDSLVRTLAARVGDQQEALDLQTFRYFSSVRALCKPDQEARYDSLMEKTFKRMGRPPAKADNDK